MTEQLLEKLHHLFYPEGTLMELDLERQALPLGDTAKVLKALTRLCLYHTGLEGFVFGGPDTFLGQ